ncbi:MAG: hypothetical protein AB4058_03360 [Microcystaceae cyanobacterium]
MITNGLILNEDFRDGLFNSATASDWTVRGPGTTFRSPNNRNFNFALSNQISEGGGSFADSAIFQPTNTQFGISKTDEIAFVYFTSFSDIAANSRELYHVQVALMQFDDTLSGPPYFGHDLSFEVENRFVSLSPAHPSRIQLGANVENQENVEASQRNAHYNSQTTPSHLDQEYTSMVIWRNQPGKGKTNIEQWGDNLVGDYNVNSELNNAFPQNQNPDFSLFNGVQIYLQRGTDNFDLIRSNVSPEEAQIGILDLKVGVTKITDFNLDFRNDARDIIRWNTFSQTNVVPTLQTGDANNDGVIDRLDFDLLVANLGVISDTTVSQSQSIYTYDAQQAINPNYIIPTRTDITPEFAYDSLTGKLYLNTKGESLNAWVISGQTATSVESLPSQWWTASIDQTQQWAILDDPSTGFSSVEYTHIATFAPGLDLKDFAPIEVGFSSGGSRLVDIQPFSGGEPKLVTGVLDQVGSEWQTVTLEETYDSLVVVATVNYGESALPAVARIRHASGNSFQIKVQNPSNASLSGYRVHYVAVEEGVYTEAQHGVNFEAVKLDSNLTDRSGSWQGEQREYINSYTAPVVVGQVMTANDPDWSVFWARGASRLAIPDADHLYVGKHVGEDSKISRVSETIGYIVMETGSGTLGDVEFSAAVGFDSIVGFDNGAQAYSVNNLTSPSVAVVSLAGQDGGDGGWGVLAGETPLANEQLQLVVDEDQVRDSERRHTTEQLSYLVFGNPLSPISPLDPKLNTGVLTNVGNDWQLVTLPDTYDSMVVVATVSYGENMLPAVVRIRNAEDNSFEIKVQNPNDEILTGYTVHFTAIEEGIYNEAEHGIKLEAVKVNSTVTDHSRSWVGEQQNYLNQYNNPVVLGQVMTANDPDWSVFWSYGARREDAPDGTNLRIGKQVGEDRDVTRQDEIIGYIVTETGSGTFDGIGYSAALGSDRVQGYDNNPWSYEISDLSAPSVAIATLSGLDGVNGGWSVLYGQDPLSPTALDLVVDEDQVNDVERSHTNEQIAYLLFDQQTMGGESVILEDNFADLSHWTDLSQEITWGNHPLGTSAFRTDQIEGQQAVFLNRLDPFDTSHFIGYSGIDDLKTFTAVDYTFTDSIERRNEILTIQFDARWDHLNGSGEGGRFLVILMDEYPEAPVSGDDLSNFVGNPYGTPALHLRIRPSGSAKSFLQYGGGEEGEFETFGNPPQWWLPGFISNTSDTGHGSPGQGNEYPHGSWKSTQQSLGSETWTTYTYKILPHRQEIYENGQLVGTMDLPENLPSAPQYDYYEQLKALRLYWRGADPAYLSNFSITTTPGLLNNTHPVISDLTDLSIDQDTTMNGISFTVDDSEIDADNLIVWAESDNLDLVSLENIVFAGYGAARTMNITPTIGETGTANITLTVSDGSLTASNTFVLSVEPLVI